MKQEKKVGRLVLSKSFKTIKLKESHINVHNFSNPIGRFGK